jgi:hypothetical protein
VAQSGGPEGLEVPVADAVVIKEPSQLSLEAYTIDNLARTTTSNLIVLVR